MPLGNAVWGDGVNNLILANNYTADGITFTTTNGTDIPDWATWFASSSKHFIFTSERGNFRRIEMTLTENQGYTNWNNAEGWTVDATSAVWEGDTNVVVIESCTTKVSQIIFVPSVKPNVVASSTTPNTYYIDPNTDVTVVATPDATHYLKNFVGGADTNSNTAVNNTFTVTADTTLTANFQAKPTLTLAQTDGGTLEAIVPQGGATAMHLTADQISTWQMDFTSPFTEADLQAFGFVPTDEATALAWTGFPATGYAYLVYSFENDEVHYISYLNGTNNGSSTELFYKGSIYDWASEGVLEFTTGASKSNVIASSTPNTYIIDYGTPVTVVATPDAQHYLVRFSDDAPATERNSNLAVEKTYDSVIADIPLSANFQAKPTLTLTQTDGGTLTLDGMTDPSPATATIQFAANGNGNTTTRTVTLPHTFSCSYSTENEELDQIIKSLYGISSGYNKPAQPPTASGNDNVTAGKSGNNHFITISAPFEGPATVTGGGYWNMTGEETVFEYNLTITILSSTPASTGLPAGVVSANATADTFVVDYGTELTLQAEPEVHHHLVDWSCTPGTVIPGPDSTASLTMTQNETVSATFAKNAPELTWEYAMTTDDTVLLANGTEISAYHGFEMDTIAKLIFSSNDEFFDAYMNALQNTGTSLLRFGSSNTNVVSFANAFDPQSLSVNAPGTATVYMVHDGSVMAYDSAYFTAVILAPDTLTLVHNDGGEMEVELGGNAVWGDGTDNIILSDQYTADGITFTRNSGDITPSGQLLGGFSFTSADGNFSRIEMTLTSNYNYTDWNNAEGWTVDGTSAVWEGDAYAVVIPQCTTYVKQITFVRGSADATNTDSIRAIVTDTTYAVVPGANVIVKATPDATHYLVNWDNDAAIYSNTDTTKHYVVNGNMTSTATFNIKPTLTLAQNENWGKVMLEGAGSGSSNGYTIKFSANGNTIVKENVTLPKTYQCEYGSPSEFDNIIRELYGWDGVHGNENAIPTVTGTDAITPGTESSSNYPKFTINSAFQGTATVTIGYTNSSWVSDNWPIEISFVPALPAGVAQLDSVTYRVDYGTEVTVIAC